MNAQELSTKAAVSVSEMAEMCQISRSRWYELVESGVFPKPVHLPSMKRPVYDRQSQEKCLEIRATGIGLNGVLVLFNRKSRKVGTKQKSVRPMKDHHPDPVNEPVMEALQLLGLTTTDQVVCETIAQLFPNGIVGLDQGDVVRKVFVHLQARKK